VRRQGVVCSGEQSDCGGEDSEVRLRAAWGQNAAAPPRSPRCGKQRRLPAKGATAAGASLRGRPVDVRSSVEPIRKLPPGGQPSLELRPTAAAFALALPIQIAGRRDVCPCETLRRRTGAVCATKPARIAHLPPAASCLPACPVKTPRRRKVARWPASSAATAPLQPACTRGSKRGCAGLV